MKKPTDYINCYYKEYNYQWLKDIPLEKRFARKETKTINSCFIMLDTETSKAKDERVKDNHVVYFTISMRCNEKNLFTLHGTRPSECIEAVKKLHNAMCGDNTIFYIQNMSYDWWFLRKFFFAEFGHPVHQLNTKSHYPIYIEFANGVILKDSLILFQRSLEKMGSDYNVEHQKAVGYWDYNKYRNQCEDEDYAEEEHTYAEFDTLCGVECLDALRKVLNKKVSSMPWTATGIPREQLRKRGKMYHAKDWFNRIAPSFEQYQKLRKVYHGGFTHANRHLVGHILTDGVQCFDFSSSYPYCLLSEKYPAEKFTKAPNCSIEQILNDKDDYAFYFKFIAIGVSLKDNNFPMPPLQFSKCEKIVNDITDNGRILCSDYIECWGTEQDLDIWNRYYNFSKAICVQVEFSKKEYLPRWITDYVFELYRDKTFLKGSNPINYALKKSELNSIYGMFCQSCVKELIEENYGTNEYEKNDEFDEQAEYEKYLENKNNILPYFMGCWVTAYAFHNLFDLGECSETWVYSDTDSSYSINWDYEKVNEYNERCKAKLKANNYGCVEFNGREYWLGIAESDGLNDQYSEYVCLGAKRYAGRCKADNEIHITVAGVPKKASAELKNDLRLFRKGFVFHNEYSGKLTHEYVNVDEIYFDEFGNEIGDSINLIPCDYLLDEVMDINIDTLIYNDIEYVNDIANYSEYF